MERGQTQTLAGGGCALSVHIDKRQHARLRVIERCGLGSLHARGSVGQVAWCLRLSILASRLVEVVGAGGGSVHRTQRNV